MPLVLISAKGKDRVALLGSVGAVVGTTVHGISWICE